MQDILQREKERSEFGFDRPTGVGPFLTDPTVIDAEVRTFLGQVIDVVKLHDAGQISVKKPSELINQLAKLYSARFMGRDPENYSFTVWNSEERLGNFLSEMLDGVPASEAVETFFMMMGSDLISKIIKPFESGQIDEETARFRSEAMIEDATFILRGLDNPIE